MSRRHQTEPFQSVRQLYTTKDAAAWLQDVAAVETELLRRCQIAWTSAASV